MVADVELCLSELAANAVQHSDLRFEIRLRVKDGYVHVAVVDDDMFVDPYATTAAIPAAGEASGRGLAIVAAVSDRHGATLISGGKAVWCAISI